MNKGGKAALIRRLHALRGQVGMRQEEYEELIGSYGVESSKELDVARLEKLCDFLQGLVSRKANDKDAARKRLLAATCAMLEDTVPGWEKMDGLRRLEYAKTTACRAAGMARRNSHGKDNFNALGLDRLRSLTYAFSKRKKDMDAVVNAMLEGLER